MKVTRASGIIMVLGILLAGCQPAATLTAQPTAIPPTAVPPTAQATSQIPTATLLAATEVPPTVTLQPSPTISLAAVPTATPLPPGGLPDVSAGVYLDDLSTPAALMLSYVNAINRHEYLRAYSYWDSPSDYIGSLDNFTNGLANTTSEAITFGLITSDGAAGSMYYTVPAVLVDTLGNGSTSRFSSCFILRLPQPANFGAPPISPMMIERGVKTAISPSTSNATALGSACTGANYPLGANPVPAVVESLSDLSNNNYIDNRSGPEELISSLLNSLNRKEYVRAYSYWQNPSSSVGSYTSYAAGFSNTGVVTATFGIPTSDVGAGQRYYYVPLGMKVTTTSNGQQTFVGCYTMHLGNPGMQATLPFQPLGITAGKFKLVSNTVDVTPLLATACN
ncbi:MAG: hypothetical protein ABSG98_12735 [Anaerolineales bacterium]|jgi:hypothetical protein